MGPGETRCRSFCDSPHTFCMQLSMILRQSVAELFDSMPAKPVSCTCVQYSVTFSDLPEVASKIISGTAAKFFGLDVIVKFGYSRSNSS